MIPFRKRPAKRQLQGHSSHRVRASILLWEQQSQEIVPCASVDAGGFEEKTASVM